MNCDTDEANGKLDTWVAIHSLIIEYVDEAVFGLGPRSTSDAREQH